MVKLDGCGVCMKVCPVQKFGMKPVMEHYVETGEVLGKGTDDLEGFPVPDGRYFGSGELPHFDREFFDFPHGTREQWLFEQLKQRMDARGRGDGRGAGGVRRAGQGSRRSDQEGVGEHDGRLGRVPGDSPQRARRSQRGRMDSCVRGNDGVGGVG